METNHGGVPVWGGIECTVHRLKDTYGNQLDRNGHQTRIEDLKLIADLGIRTLRYPVIWERIAPNGLEKADWSWADERLYRLKELGITPIASFLHHGSGPMSTSLVDPDFPQKLTEFAVAVAERYPWLQLFTPVNEPLTTARFSCLYGFWYPHAKDHHSFATALFNQCKGTIMAMHAIRQIIPGAKLVQTEDLGKCHATEKLQYQCNFENQRRWASLDLLSGILEKNPIMLEYFREKAGMGESEIAYFLENSYPPDVVGINYYITSERALDEELHKYPAWSYTDNEEDQYADVEIVRADIHRREGHYKLLKEAAQRYSLPVAFTEVHLGSTRDEQMRWFVEAYDAASRLKEEGIDVRGVTVWSMLGAYDWNSLLTKKKDFYEPGVFDVRSGVPRPTAIAGLIKTICAGEKPDHPVLHAEGWWKNPGAARFMFTEKPDGRELPAIEEMFPRQLPSPTASPILITGATGTLGRAFARICSIRNISYVLLDRHDMDIADRQSVERILEEYQPWAVINAAGFVRVDEAEGNRDLCFRENTLGPKILAEAAQKYGAMFLSFSSDLVFDGNSRTPYVENNPVAPLNVYGLSKVYAEREVLKVNPAALLIRTSAFFGPWDEHNFVARMIAAVERGEPFMVPTDQIISPTYVPDLVNHCLDLVIDKASGLWHLTNPSAVTWMDFALAAAEATGLDTALIKSADHYQTRGLAPLPAFRALGSERGMLLPKLPEAITRFASERLTNSVITVG